MPIFKHTLTDEIIQTAPNKGDLFAQTGVANNGNFAVSDRSDLIKQIKFDPAAQTTNTTTTIASGAAITDITLTLPATAGTFSTAAFKTVQTDLGTSPVATTPTSVLTLTSGDGSVTITGNSTTKTVDIRGVSGSAGINQLTGDGTAGPGTGSQALTITNLALSKLAATTISRALASDASGFITFSSVTSTELSRLSGVTSQLRGNDWAAFARVSGNDFTTSLSTAVDATNLSFGVGANTTWSFRLRLFGGCSTTFGIRTALSFPTGCVVKAGSLGVRAGSTGVQWENVWANTGTLTSAGTPLWTLASTAQTALIEGLIVNGANAGVVQVQAASAVTGDTTTISQNSFIKAFREV